MKFEMLKYQKLLLGETNIYILQLQDKRFIVNLVVQYLKLENKVASIECYKITVNLLKDCAILYVFKEEKVLGIAILESIQKLNYF